jgi:hypothetical protein
VIAKEKAGNKGLTGIVNESRLFSKPLSLTSIFLSHSHQDKDVVEQAKLFFENLGIQIYVDWADMTMPESTNSTTALKIKNQIASINDKFVLLATNKAIESKWCNWEIGIADTFKFRIEKMAILPLTENSGSWIGNEYLMLYPRIELKSIVGFEDGFFVIYPDGKPKLLKLG